MASKPVPESTRTSTATKENPLRLIEAQGQAVWLDYIRRSILSGGDLKRLVDEDGLLAASPAIRQFSKRPSPAVRTMTSKLESLLAANSAMDDGSLFEAIAVKDIQSATDILRPVYDRTKGADGFVSLEVSPKLAQRHRRNHSRSAASLESRWPAKPDDQSSGHARRHSRRGRAAGFGN